jgi:signal transduction histidine kinase
VETLHHVLQERSSERDARATRLERLCTMGEMAGNLIHKFNNTLTIMMGHLDLLLEDVVEEDLRGRLKTVSAAASDGVQLAKTLQQFIRSGPAEPEPLEVEEIISETVRMTEPIWSGRSRHLGGSIHLDCQLPGRSRIVGNPGELREVFTNLILNAIDAMPQGGSLSIRATRQNGSLLTEVADTGVGMSESVQNRIFQPFFTTKGEEGNGMGLSIVRRIVEEHGGQIDVDSQPGRGSRFTVSLPLQATGKGAAPFADAPPVAQPIGGALPG